jgi:hypothetical protein
MEQIEVEMTDDYYPKRDPIKELWIGYKLLALFGLAVALMYACQVIVNI